MHGHAYHLLMLTRGSSEDFDLNTHTRLSFSYFSPDFSNLSMADVWGQIILYSGGHAAHCEMLISFLASAHWMSVLDTPQIETIKNIPRYCQYPPVGGRIMPGRELAYHTISLLQPQVLCTCHAQTLHPATFRIIHPSA